VAKGNLVEQITVNVSGENPSVKNNAEKHDGRPVTPCRRKGTRVGREVGTDGKLRAVRLKCRRCRATWKKT